MNRHFTVGGMTCGHCKASVERALGGLPGISKVEVELSGGRVAVQADPAAITDAQIREAIDAIGFEVTGGLG